MIRHRFDTFSALAGAACLALVAAVTLRTGPLGLTELRLIGPLVVLALGVSLLASGGRVARGDHGDAGPGRGDSEAERDQPGTDEHAGDGREAEGDDG